MVPYTPTMVGRGFGRMKCIPVKRERLVDAVMHLAPGAIPPDEKAAKRFLTYAQGQNLPLDMCWAVERPDGNLFPAVLVVPNTGRTGLFFASTPESPAGRENLSSLIRHALDQIDPDRVALAQALLEPYEGEALVAYLDAGFSRLADLSYLERRISPRRKLSEPDWPAECTIETLSPENPGAFREALAGSYIDTLDCPGLCGMRSIDDIIEGHRATGKHNPEIWFLVRWAGEPAAVLLFTPIPEQDLVELCYIGVHHDFRGRAIASNLLTHGLNRLAEGKCGRKVTLAVDDQNEPALGLYRAFGFYRTERRIAVIKQISLPETPAPPPIAPPLPPSDPRLIE